MATSSTFPEIFDDKLDNAAAEERDNITRELSNIRSDELSDNPIPGNYDKTHFENIHKHLFQDVSSHAGVTRGYGMRKGLSHFAEPHQLPYLFEKELPKRIEALNQSVNDRELYIEGMTDLHSTLDIAHPFREGNGRATRAFMSQLAKEHGYELDFSKINKDQWVKACIHSLNSGNEELKRPLFENIVKPTPERSLIINEQQNKVKFWRDVVVKEVENLPKDQQIASLTKYDEMAKNPDFIKNIEKSIEQDNSESAGINKETSEESSDDLSI